MGTIKWFANIAFVKTLDKLTGNEQLYGKYFRNGSKPQDFLT